MRTDLTKKTITINGNQYFIAEDKDGNQYWFADELRKAFIDDVESGNNYFAEEELADEEWKAEHTAQQRAKWFMDDHRDSDKVLWDMTPYDLE